MPQASPLQQDSARPDTNLFKPEYNAEFLAIRTLNSLMRIPTIDCTYTSRLLQSYSYRTYMNINNICVVVRLNPSSHKVILSFRCLFSTITGLLLRTFQRNYDTNVMRLGSVFLQVPWLDPSSKSIAVTVPYHTVRTRAVPYILCGTVQPAPTHATRNRPERSSSLP